MFAKRDCDHWVSREGHVGGLRRLATLKERPSFPSDLGKRK